MRKEGVKKKSMNGITTGKRPRHRLFDGRVEKRLRVSVAVYLTRSSDHDAREQTVTENISPHGARVVSKQYCEAGEDVVLTTGEFSQVGRVVYCEKAGDQYHLGLEFSERSLKWETISTR